MNYVSTRGQSPALSSASAIKQGLASDGGLFMPDSIPALSSADIERLIPLSYPERAADILARYLTDYTYDELLADCRAAYAEERFPGGPAPVKTLKDGISVLELWHGPTCAFKDMALQIMPRLLSRALTKSGEKRTAVILVATSGDTGKAALEGYRDADQVKIMVFYPVNGVSRIQKLQMATQEGNNVTSVSVVGNFDDTQTGVKKIFSDPAVAKTLDQNGYFLSSANSINWGRLVPQIVYYISAYCDLVKNGTLKNGEPMDVCVPTGNFGNIFAGFLAARMGLPIGRFVCASNKNNILTDFFETGVYDRNRPFYTTMSPSMDILISSNLERLLWLMTDADTTRSLMTSLNTTGRYEISGDLKKQLDERFTGLSCDEAETADVIRRAFCDQHYLIDTHTAVALGAAEKYRAAHPSDRPMLVVSTASPYKFSPNVLRSVTGQTPDDEFAAIEALRDQTGTAVPAPIAGIRSKKIRFDPEKAIEAGAMLDTVLANLGIR